MQISRRTLLIFAVAVVLTLALMLGRQDVRVTKFNMGRSGTEVSQVAPALPSRDVGMMDSSFSEPSSSYMMGRPDVGIMPYPVPGGGVVGGELFIQETTLSLVSRDPEQSEAQIRQAATDLGGFLVSSTLSRPEEWAQVTVVVRVPSDQLEEALRRFEASGERVIHKAIQGDDVTQQYQDLAARLETLNRTQARLETLLTSTTDASALLQIQQQILQIQEQKDSIEGQRRYLEGAANLSRVTIFIASDELALPYVPAETWRPEAIFRLAVRSLVSTLRGAGTLAIWAVVFSPVILGLAVPVIWLWWRSNQRMK